MRRVWITLAATLAVLAIAPAAEASTASKIRALQKAVKQLQAVNKTQTAQIAALKAHDNAADGNVDTVAGATLLLLGLQTCVPNVSGLDQSQTFDVTGGAGGFVFSELLTNGAPRQYWYSGDAVGPSPAGGVLPCLSSVAASASAARSTRAAGISRFGFDGLRARTDALASVTTATVAKAMVAPH